MKPADWAWVALGAAVAAYELHAPRKDWELLSEACDRYRERHPIVIISAIILVAAHLTRVVPPRLDPLHQLAVRLPR